jgi:LysM repeat protein
VTLEGGTYRFTTTSDDGVRVWVDGRRIIDNWTSHTETTDVSTLQLSPGEHALQVEYFENTGLALPTFSWERVTDGTEEQVSIMPTSGPPGTEVEVTAQGFAPNTDVTIGVSRLDAEPTTSRTVRTDVEGKLQTTTVIPPNEAQPGEPWGVLVTSVDTGERALSGTFEVTPGPGQGCGDRYVVQQGEWLAQIARKCNTTVDAILAANPDIDNPSLVYPGQVLNMPGPETPAEATLSITPESGSPGTEIQVTGTNLLPNATANVSIGRANSEPTTSHTANIDALGNLKTSIILPREAQPGQPWMVMVGYGLDISLSETFTVTGADVTATTLVNLNLRPLPTTDSEVSDVIPAGTSVPVLARHPDRDWFLVRYDGRRGWVAGWLTLIEGDLATVPEERP